MKLSFGDPKIKITSIAEPSLASEHDIALAIHPKYLDDLNGTSAECALLTKGVDWAQYGLRAILVSRPKFAMSTLSAMVDRGQHYNLEFTHRLSLISAKLKERSD